MDFDTALETVGDFGWSQIFHLAVLIVPNLCGGFYTISNSFVGKAPHFICAEKPNEDPCSVQPPCQKFVYDSSFTSIVTEWDLVCEKQQLAELAQSAFMIGNFIGCLICGFLGDKFGRLNTGIVCNLLCVLAQMAGAHAQTYEQYAVNRFFVGFASGGAGLVLATIVLENLRSHWRSVGATLLCVSFALSISFTAMWAYRVREWRAFLWTCNIFMLPFCLVWFVPKSPRWLLSQGRTQEAEDILFNYGHKNGKITSRDSVKLKPPNGSSVNAEVKSYGAMDAFRTPEMNRRMKILLWGWGTCGLLYYGLTVSSSNLGGNMYVNVAMSGLVEIPSAFISSFLSNRIGRNRTIAGSIGLAAVACLAIVMSSTNSDGAMTTFQTYCAMTAKFGVAAAFSLQGLYSSELIPTVIRNIGTGFCFMASRVGGILAPVLIAYCSGVTVYFVYALMSAVYCLTVLTLPETLNKPMPENIDDVEAPV
ncbi:solute carrier family 22 member 15-like [Amphiura filiformis]|uniref:solute carrier family 22 member 15-like n=1 Tax=Amphiura filiformis TaxID=82378 RepID=UPI003B2137DC